LLAQFLTVIVTTCLKVKNNYTIFIKVLVGFTLTATIFSIAGFITHKSLSQLEQSVNSISSPNFKLQIMSSIDYDIWTAEQNVLAFIINPEKEKLVAYYENVTKVRNELIDLTQMTYNSQSLSYIDSLKKYADLKFRLLDENIALKQTKKAESAINYLLSKLPPEKNAEPIKPKLEEKKNGKWWNIFSKSKKEDTLLFKSVPQINLRKVVEEAQAKEQLIISDKLTKEAELNEATRQATDRINFYIDALEKFENKSAITSVNEVTIQTSKYTSLILYYLGAAGLLITLMFVYLVYRDVNRSNRLNMQLIASQAETERLARLKEQFLARVSHEIRTPMNVIVGFSEQLAKTEMNSKQTELMQGIEISSEHVLKIINEILDYSKIDSGNVRIEKIGFDLNKLSAEIKLTLKEVAKKKKIDFDVILENDFPVLKGDPVRLKQILFNLAGNALKFTNEGKVTIRFKTEGETSEQLILKTTVTDTGIGIPNGKIQSVFEEFQQADETITRKFGGTGLGLSISKRLVELHGGTISVSSLEGQGSEFTFLIPYKKGNISDLPIEDNSLEAELNLEGMNILVVDDDQLNQAVLQYLLEDCGAKVTVADNGQIALDKIEADQFDFVFMDMHMPVMDGVTALHEIRSNKNEEISKLPVIAVTGDASKREASRFYDAGINDYITKPYKEAEVISVIKKQLKKAIDLTKL